MASSSARQCIMQVAPSHLRRERARVIPRCGNGSVPPRPQSNQGPHRHAARSRGRNGGSTAALGSSPGRGSVQNRRGRRGNDEALSRWYLSISAGRRDAQLHGNAQPKVGSCNSTSRITFWLRDPLAGLVNISASRRSRSSLLALAKQNAKVATGLNRLTFYLAMQKRGSSVEQAMRSCTRLSQLSPVS